MQKKEKVHLLVQGMNCTNCSLSVRKVLEKQGAEVLSVDFASGETVFLAPSSTSVPVYVSAIEKAGFQVQQAGEKKKGISLEIRFFVCLFFTIPLLLHMFIHWHWLHNAWVQLALSIPVMLLGFPHFLRSAYHSLKTGVPNMDVLISLGSLSAFVYSLSGFWLFYEQPEAADYLFFETTASIITLVLLGNLLEHRSVAKTTSSIAELTALQQVKAKKVEQTGSHETYTEISAEEIQAGDVLLVNSGDTIPTDGQIIWGEAHVNEAMLTGEAMPVRKDVGASITGGTLLDSGSFKMQADRVGQDTTLARIISLVKSARESQPAIQKLGDKISAVFVPVVVGIALLTFLITFFWLQTPVSVALMRAVAVLVISCPCAMGLATPTAVVVGIGRMARKGMLVKGGDTLEQLAKAKYFVFDKTGTITTGNFKLESITLYADVSEQEVKNLVYTAERHSSHPIARSLFASLKEEAQVLEIENIQEIKGKGMSFSDTQGNNYLLGSSLLNEETREGEKHAVLLFKNKVLIAGLSLTDEIKTEAEETIRQLKQKGIMPVLLSGDTKSKCVELAKKIGITEVYAEKSPEEKLQKIEELSAMGITVMIGDGINDAPALSKAHIGISLSRASDVAIESARVIIFSESSLYPVYETYAITRKTYTTIKQNLFWAFFYNVLAIPLAAVGMLSPIIAAFTMAFSDVIVVGNSLWLRIKKVH